MHKEVEYRVGNMTVKIHGSAPSKEAMEAACIRFMTAVSATTGRRDQHGDDLHRRGA